VAEALGVHIGTVHRNLGRVRERHPALHAAVMAERRRQLAEYHELVLEHRRRRSLAWGRRRYAARYRREHGRWPWEAHRSAG
jgi:transposase